MYSDAGDMVHTAREISKNCKQLEQECGIDKTPEIVGNLVRMMEKAEKPRRSINAANRKFNLFLFDGKMQENT